MNDASKQLVTWKRKVAKLEAQVTAARQKELLKLPGRHGYASMVEFIEALRGLSVSAARPVAGKRKKRRAITPEVKKGVAEAVKAGKTGAAIATEFGISLPSVQNIKKAAGLVKKR